MCTSAWAPKRLPDELIRYLAKRGQDKVMIASDYPVLPIDRCVREAQELGLESAVLEKYLYGNAERVFFGERRSRYVEHAPL
jgi:predicted TIM-barrel fold metal-dependent hydrolase